MLITTTRYHLKKPSKYIPVDGNVNIPEDSVIPVPN